MNREQRNPRWRKNGHKLTKRKNIREEARRRWLESGRTDLNASQVYDWVHTKIRAFYAVAPLDVVWPIKTVKVLP